MRRILPITLFAAATSLAANGAFAQADSAPIASNSQGALEAPEDWECGRYEDDWREWIDAGNTPEAWRFSGKTYRAVSDGDLYTWNDWLEWSEENGCITPAYYIPENSGGAFLITTGVGLITGVFGVGLATASGGENSMSPG